MTFTSALGGFHKLSQDEKIKKIQELIGLSEDEVSVLTVTDPPVTIENMIGVMTMPIGIATNFKINDVDKLITFAVEEASVVAAASNAAKIARFNGGFTTSNTGPFMIGQIQLLEVPNPKKAAKNILGKKTN